MLSANSGWRYELETVFKISFELPIYSSNSNGYHTLQPTNTTSKSKIGKPDGSASSTCWYAVLLEQAHKQNWPATSKSISVWVCWLNCLPSWHKLWYYYLLPKSKSYLMGCFFRRNNYLWERLWRTIHWAL